MSPTRQPQPPSPTPRVGPGTPYRNRCSGQTAGESPRCRIPHPCQSPRRAGRAFQTQAPPQPSSPRSATGWRVPPQDALVARPHAAPVARKMGHTHTCAQPALGLPEAAQRENARQPRKLPQQHTFRPSRHRNRITFPSTPHPVTPSPPHPSFRFPRNNPTTHARHATHMHETDTHPTRTYARNRHWKVPVA